MKSYRSNRSTTIDHGYAMESKDAFVAALIEVCSRVWMELENICVAAYTTSAAHARPSVAIRVQMLRLDLTLILGRCRTAQWKTRLNESQRLTLQSILGDVLATLNSSSDEIPDLRVIESAQNRLFDAVLEHGPRRLVA